MARPQCTTVLWLLAICLSVAVITADVEDGSCTQAGPGEQNEPGLCPPIKIRVPYPGFDGNYGVNAMYHHAGARWYTSVIDGHNHEAVWYEHKVPVSADHGAFTLILFKDSNEETGVVSWKLERHIIKKGADEPTVELVSELKDDVTFPWQSTKWVPQIQVSEMSWDVAHQQAIKAVKAALRYAQLVKGFTKKQKTPAKLHRAANNVKTAIIKVREIEHKATDRGYVFGHNHASGSAELTPLDKAARDAAMKAASNVNGAWWHNTGHSKQKFMHQRGKGSSHGAAGGSAHSAKEALHKHEKMVAKKLLAESRKEAAEAIKRAKAEGKEKGAKQVASKAKGKRDAAKAKAAKAKAAKEKAAAAKAAAAKAAAEEEETGSLSISGVTAEHLKNPAFKEAFVSALAHSLGVKASDIHIAESSADDDENAHMAAYKPEGSAKPKKVASTPKLKVKGKGKSKGKAEEKQSHGTGSGSGKTKGKTKGKKDSYSSGHEAKSGDYNSGSGEIETLLEDEPPQAVYPSTLLGSRNVKITFKVHGKDHMGTLNNQVKSGDFNKDLKAQAHNKGIEVDPHASVIDPKTGKVLQGEEKPKSYGSGTGSAVIVPPAPVDVPLAPSPPGKLPEDTRWDQKGKTGTFTRCASATFGGHLMLMCPHGTVISKVIHADLGFATGPWCGWDADPMCSFPDALPLVKSACEGQANCIIPTDLDLLAVQKPEPAGKLRLDLDEANNMQTKDATTIVQEAGSQARFLKVSKLPRPNGRVVKSAVDDAVADVLKEDPLAPGVSRQLLFQAKNTQKCWAAKDNNGHYTGRLTVRAECKGTMIDAGLRTAPSLALGKVTLAGLPAESFKVAKGYHTAFSMAVEAAMCQCDVTKKACIMDECAGAVEIKKMGGDAADTDVEFQVRVPPTRTASDVEAVLALELHSESKRYMEKEMAKKAAVKRSEMMGYMTEEQHEAHNKARVQANEQKEKGIYQEEQTDEEKRAKEKTAKIDSAKWTAEKNQKKFQNQAEAAQDDAAKAAEKNLKAHLLHQEARAKRRAAKEVLDKRQRAAQEVTKKSQVAAASYSQAQKGVDHTEQLANSASEAFGKKHATAQMKVRSVQELKSETPGNSGIAGGDSAKEAPVATLLTDDDEKADQILNEDSVVEEAVEKALDGASFLQTDASVDVHPTFSQNFVAAAKMQGLKAPPIGASVKFWKAQQASAEADAAQLGVPAPPPVEPGWFDTVDIEGLPNWFDELLIILLILLLIIICMCCCCQDGMRGYSPYKRTGDDYAYHEDVARQRENAIRSGQVDANGLPIMRGDSREPIGLGGIGNQGSRALLNNMGNNGSNYASGPSVDPRREHQKKVVAEELDSAYRELNAVPWYKRQAVQSRINELLKWQSKLDDENRPMYMSAHDPTTGFPKGAAQDRQWQQSVNQFEHTVTQPAQQQMPPPQPPAGGAPPGQAPYRIAGL